MQEKIIRPRGTADTIPSESYKWQFVEEKLKKTAALFGHKEIRFPTFEHTELFCRGVGETTDIVSKEMYTFEDNGGRSISLRPEGTASTVRAYLENSLYALPAPFRVFYIAPNFRYEKPQAGRFREHHQFGAELFGSYFPYADAEIISLADTALKSVGLKDTHLEINSIGCSKCRPAFRNALISYFSSYKDKLCPTCLSRLEKNPLRILDCKNEECRQIAINAPKTIDYLCDDCQNHLKVLCGELDLLGISWKLNERIVRGLDYYTRTVFEFVSPIGTICGGGRYDRLIEQLGGAPTGAVGFGCGLERLISVMEGSGCSFGEQPVPSLFLITADASANASVHKLANELRALGIDVMYDLCERSVKAQMKYADKINAAFTAVIGENELKSGSMQLKNMSDGSIICIPVSAQGIFEALKQNKK